MKKGLKKSIIAISVAVFLVSGCATQAVKTETQVLEQFPALAQAKSLLATAESQNHELFSPDNVEVAIRDYEKALSAAKTGKANVAQLATSAIQSFNAASAQVKEANYVFDDVFTARKKALNVNAHVLVKEQFNEAEVQFRKMLAQLEDGEDDRAKRDLNDVKNQFLAAELAALKTNMLSFAEQALASAKKQDLDDSAPVLLAQAQDEYRLALDTLEADRTNIVQANVHANKTISLVNRAKHLTDIQQYFENSDFSEEQKILWFQEQLAYVMSPLHSEMAFDTPTKDIVSDSRRLIAQELEEAQSLLLTIQTLESELSQAKLLAAESETRLQRDKDQAVLQAQMEVQRQQQAKREEDARFAGVQALFLENEATVYRQLDNVLIRAHGFSFRPGSSEIESNNFALLNKITEAISRFDNPRIKISGHTDSTGSSELNLSLSEARALTVADFLVKVGKFDALRMESEGFGKEKPVATNETAEGRAQNRRVEILIINS
jgi:outer membrane protein OmpA-like peptidoglycan-associated protein|tara:strand:+ start:2056 stop:3537 length:1482 start_codon:yes stop_codon:yes gene_type:complete